MATINTIDINLARGNDEKINIRILDAEKEPLIMKGDDELFFTLKPASKPCGTIDTIILQKSFENGIVNNEDGTYSVILSAGETEVLKGAYRYDVKCVFALEEKALRKTALQGSIVFKDTLTRIDEEERG